MKINKEWEIPNGKYKCPHCDKVYTKNGIATHIWRMHGAGKNFDPNSGYKSGKRSAWNKGKTKDTCDNVKKYANNLSKRFASGELEPTGCFSKDYYGTEEHIKNSSKGGGYRQNSGRSKGAYVKDSFGNKVYLQSSYEIACASILDELGIEWERPKFINYELDGKERKYYPDFYLTNQGVYLDPKNPFLAKQDAKKINAVQKQNNVVVHVLTEEKITKEFIASLV